ncbi:hypothetical protein M2222_001643 [Bradyrhizobium elkanii]|uniref:hypothetical protein n=1 Tax=Bradyrhizobium elkanii TaxID=29448 RepID=UPI0021679B50|nr:hypothetical protein [Bradyrhizobium elkanii]MCS3449536.1 hypothetical protein [Bradyrhizobium elkanii]MCS3559321.1 hypothetical protein [Bradyrhizobium elkanii]MCW2150833.1 hypothetical protein [Bradyrhizobium elkanii]MCW2374564.1 hypothetical protein [Bradyrhizobium elkanii]
MSDDYFEQNKRSGINRGADPAPEAQEKWFAALDHDQRALMLDTYDKEDAATADQALSIQEAFDGTERRLHVARLHQIHAALRRSNR